MTPGDRDRPRQLNPAATRHRDGGLAGTVSGADVVCRLGRRLMVAWSQILTISRLRKGPQAGAFLLNPPECNKETRQLAVDVNKLDQF